MRRMLVAVCVAMALCGVAVLASGDQDFVLVNKTGMTIDELYVSPSNANDWGEDILGQDTLDNNQKATIRFHHTETECLWDLKIVDEDGDDVTWEDINLCKASEITLKYEGKRPTALIK